MSKLLSGLFLLLVGITGLYGQTPEKNGVPEAAEKALTDTLGKAVTSPPDTALAKSKQLKKFYPVPKRALMFSLLTPGLGGGQFYNRDYWKVPLVVVGYGVSGFFIVRNLKGYRSLVKSYKSFYDLNPGSPNYGKPNPDIEKVEVRLIWEKQTVELTLDQVKRVKDSYRRLRDWSFFAGVAVYALSAIEANVAAHLKTFDLTDDLTLRVQPAVVNPQGGAAVPGLRLVMAFK